jgi:DNA-binding transcriptional LysR family regulator
VTPDLRFDNRQVDLIGEGYDAAIGAGFELTSGIVARELARAQVVAVATPAFLAGRPRPEHPRDLLTLPGIAMRSMLTGRVRSWVMRSKSGEEFILDLQPRITMNDAEALARAALLGVGVALVPMPHVVAHLESGALVRLLPEWRVDLGGIWLYFASKHLLPAKTRVFVDHIVEQFRKQRLASRFAVA